MDSIEKGATTCPTCGTTIHTPRSAEEVVGIGRNVKAEIRAAIPIWDAETATMKERRDRFETGWTVGVRMWAEETLHLMDLRRLTVMKRLVAEEIAKRRKEERKSRKHGRAPALDADQRRLMPQMYASMRTEVGLSPGEAIKLLAINNGVSEKTIRRCLKDADKTPKQPQVLSTS